MTDSETTPSFEDLSAISTNEDKTKEERDEASANETSNDVQSTVQSEADETLQDSCRKMFEKISEYLKSELSGSLEDYELLEKLNELTKQKYQEMDNITKALTGRMDGINEKYTNLQPFLAMIDKVDTSVTNLEQAAYKLDTYSKELEARFKKLEKSAS